MDVISDPDKSLKRAITIEEIDDAHKLRSEHRSILQEFTLHLVIPTVFCPIHPEAKENVTKHQEAFLHPRARTNHLTTMVAAFSGMVVW